MTIFSKTSILPLPAISYGDDVGSPFTKPTQILAFHLFGPKLTMVEPRYYIYYIF